MRTLCNYLTAMFCCLLLAITQTTAQSTANYTTTIGTASLLTMAGNNPVNLIDANKDDDVTNVLKIGFDFYMMGVRYDQFSVNSNGAIKLGQFRIGAQEFNGGSNPFPQIDGSIIAPFLANLATSNTGKIHYALTGTSPNRRLTVEFLNMKISNLSGAPTATSQVSIFETSGKIRFDYSNGAFNIGSSAGVNAIVGFNAGTATNTVKTISAASPHTENNSSAITITNFSTPGSTIDLKGKSVEFTPSIAPSLLGSLVASNATTTTTDLSWTDASGETGYAIYGSIDNTNFSFYKQVAANTTNTTVTGLIPTKLYYWRLYAVSEGQLTAAPIATSFSTLGITGYTSNTATITTEGSTTYPFPHVIKWSSLSWSNGLPKADQNVELILDIPATTKNEVIEVLLDVPNITMNRFTLKNTNSNGSFIKVLNTVGNTNITILDDCRINSPGGNSYNRTNFGNLGSTAIYGNCYVGSQTPSVNEGHASIGHSATLSFGQRSIFYKDLYFYPRGYSSEEWTIFWFVKSSGNQYVYNETLNTDTVRPVQFQNLFVGNGSTSNKLIFAGAAKDAYVFPVGSAGIDIFDNATLELNNGYSITKATGAGTPYVAMAGTARLKLGGFSSIDRDGNNIGVAGSNFTNGFSWASLGAASTIEYFADNSATQTIHSMAGLTYQNLEFTNNSGVSPIGRAQKITTAATNLRVAQKFRTMANADVTLQNTVSVYNGTNILTETDGGLYCGTQVISPAVGTNSQFNNQPKSFLGIGSPDGIAASGTSGNVQTGIRNFSPHANYIYYGTAPQITGTGLPATGIHELTIDNPTTLTQTNNTLAAKGAVYLKQGLFDINGKKFTLDSNSSVLYTTGSIKANVSTVELKGITGTQTLSGSWFVGKNISSLINANSTGFVNSAATNDSLLISHALLYGAGTTNSQINTNNNLTLLSRDTGTARFGELALGSGNSIIGKVNVERYTAAQRKWRLHAWPTNSTQTAQQSWMEGSTTPNDNPQPGYGCIITDEQDTWALNNFDSKSISGPSVKYYDALLERYVGIPNTRSYQMNSKSAYYTFVRGDRTSLPSPVTLSTTILRNTGTLKTGTINVSIPANKFDMVGNPYASPIDLRLLDTSNLTSTFYVWDPKLTGLFGLGAYQTLFASGSTYRIMPGGGSYGPALSEVTTIESGQGFFVRSTNTGGLLRFKEVAKTVEAITYGRGNEAVDFEYITAMLNTVSNENKILVDGALTLYGDNYNNAIDFGDKHKLVNLSENVGFLRNGIKYAIEQRKTIDEVDTLFIHLANVKIGKYSWDFTLKNMPTNGRTAFLIDKHLNSRTALNSNAEQAYDFEITNAAASYANDRFLIVLKQPKQAPVIAAEITPTASTLAIAPTVITNQTLNILTNPSYFGNYNISIYNTAGSLIQSSTVLLNSLKNTIALPNVSSGTYFVKIENAKFDETFKVVVN
jgi:hypothetical protein